MLQYREFIKHSFTLYIQKNKFIKIKTKEVDIMFIVYVFFIILGIIITLSKLSQLIDKNEQ